jgi:peptide/nickel transport system substrate-binding protein
VTPRKAVRTIALACTLVAAACSHAGTVAGDTSTLRIGISTEPHSLNPLDQYNGQEMVIERLFTDTLTSFDPTGNRVVPVLASGVPARENGDISADGKTVVFHLRRGVKWQDGAPFTSADVVFTYRQVMNPNNNPVTRFGYDQIDLIEAPDAFTVRLHLKRPFSPIVTTFFGDANAPYGILPKHLLEQYRSLERIPYDEMPIGTGPFRVVSWRRGDRIELVANPHYFLGMPRIARITIFFAHDEQTLLTMAGAREIDWVAELSPTLYEAARRVPDYHIVLVAQNRWYGITINLQRKVLQDVRVRRAIELSIDKPTITNAMTFGTALPATQDLPSFLWATGDLSPSRYDPAQARALLAQAGYSSSHALHIELAYNSGDETARKTAVLLQSALANVGVVLSLKGYPNEMLTAPAAMGGIEYGGRFDLDLGRIINGPEPDNSAEYACAGFPPNGYNMSHYCTPEMDRLQRIATSSYDRATRRAAYASIEALLERDLPQIPLWWPHDVHLVSDRLQNFDPNPFVETWDAWRWSLTNGGPHG